ncbi:MAG TPA: GNAT family N-acetyltransferase [Anaerolineales bacterium]|nr:GNAT family N-acetyltransferase [Anaerolineales bacterium]
MTISIDKTPDLEALKSALNPDCLPGLLPPLDELMSIAKLRNVETFSYHACREEQTIGVAVFIQEKRSIRGLLLNTFSLLGHDYLDYNFFFCVNDHLDEFLKYISNDLKKYKFDAIVLENIAFFDTRKSTQQQTVDIFDASKEPTGEGFNAILKKRRLKKQYNKGTRRFKYSCEHKTSSFSKEDVQALAHLHRERWNLDGVKSAFDDNERVDVYCAHQKNKVLTVMRDGNEIIAAHYGMILGESFLFHTPAINIKYLEFSPLQVLLFEIAAFCQKSNLSVLDFGLGDEEYKKRFSNACREVSYLLIPLSFKGAICRFILGKIDTGTLKTRSARYFKNIKTAVRKIINMRRRIIYYAVDRASIPKASNIDPGNTCNMLIIKEFFDLVPVFRINNIEMKRHHYNRIRAGCVLFCLMEGDSLLSYGWGTEENIFFVSEVSQNICNKGKMLLFDFVTPSALRRRGYYSLLLGKICAALSHKNLVIFAEQKNVASNRAIAKSGFAATSYETV